MKNELNTLFSKYSNEISSLGYEARKYVLSKLKNIEEIVDLPANMVAYGYGPGYNDMICTIIASKKGMKIGFYKGSEFPDPENILTGSGKVHKYAEIRSLEDLNKPGLSELFEEAVSAYKKRS